MSIIGKAAAVRAAQARMQAARREAAVPAAALLARGREHPLTVVGAAAGAGFVLGRLDVHPLNVPGLTPLLKSGAAELVAQAAGLIAELGLGGGESA